MLKWSKANAKTARLAETPGLAWYLRDGRKVYSLDLLSGHSCPFAEKCLSKAVETDGKRTIKDGPKTEFRCFSASQEAQYPSTYNARKHNYDILKNAGDAWGMKNELWQSIPKNAGVVRIHVAGDFFNREYFKAWMYLAKEQAGTLFYAYTKSLRYWIDNVERIPDNMVLTASYGGRDDHLIEKHGLRSATVVFSESEANIQGLEIDHDDSHAADRQGAIKILPC